MKKDLRKIKKLFCYLLAGLFLAEQAVAAVRAEESAQYAMEAEARAVGSIFDVGDLKYQISDTVTPRVICIGRADNSNIGQTLIIPNTVMCDGIPYEVWRIEDQAFDSCGSAEIQLPSTLTQIGAFSFQACSFESIHIPEGVSSIGESAFQRCRALKSITIPDGVTSISYSAMMECDKLESVVLPESITTIEAAAFSHCSSLKSINIPKEVTVINASAFNECSSLTKMKLWDTVSLNGSGLFQNCQNLSVLQIVVTRSDPIAVKYFSVPTFDGCPDDRRLVFLDQNGDELTGDALTAAQRAYQAVDDGDKTDNLWYGWKIGDFPAASYSVTATTNGGGTISPDKTVNVSKGGSQTFTITPQEGYEIKEVLVDGSSQGAIASYTFTNVTGNHTISVSFERKKENEGGGGTDNPGGTENSGGNKDDNSGTDKSDENKGETGVSAGTNTTDNSNAADDGDDTGTETESSHSQSASATNASGQSAGAPGEPKTGNTFHVGIYVTVAMIADLLYLHLYFADSKGGMTEYEKRERVEAWIKWARGGHSIRKYIALAAIFFLLFYYYSIGKRAEAEWGKIYQE